MRRLPLADPGTPDVRSAGAYLLWVARGQIPTLFGAVVSGILWMLSQALIPAVLGNTIDRGFGSDSTRVDSGAVLVGCVQLLLLGIAQNLTGVTRHRLAASNARISSYRTLQVVTRHSVRYGAALSRRQDAGGIVGISAVDILHIGNVTEIVGRAAGSVVAFTVVVAILFSTSPVLGFMTLVGAPLLMLAVGPMLAPLHRRQDDQRALMGHLGTYAVDLVLGLRVLRGIGGEQAFLNRYRDRSQQTRTAGVKAARVESLLDAAQVFLPGMFVVLAIWMGARLALAGAITVGDVVTLYGFAAFLVLPLRTATEAADKWSKGMISARRVVDILRLDHGLRQSRTLLPVPEPGHPHELWDRMSGLCAVAGRTTAVACTMAADSTALADRLGRYVDGDVLFRGVPVEALAIEDFRDRVYVVHTDSWWFADRLRDALDPGHAHSDTEILDAIRATCAEDILNSLPDGLDSWVEPRGWTLSGGQRQRLVLARALLADPEVLILVEPASAVDSHTEALLARRLPEYRRGRTTLIIGSSPLMPAQADDVALFTDGKVTARGTHRELLATDPAYRRFISARGVSQEPRLRRAEPPGPSPSCDHIT